jgi:hypothetical protein
LKGLILHFALIGKGLSQLVVTIFLLLSETPVVVIITVYEPDPTEWINGKIRG